jgi:hypothetical protein
MAGTFSAGLIQGFTFIVLLVTFALVLRHRAAAAVALAVLILGSYAAVGVPVTIWQVLIAGSLTFVFARYGVLAAVVAQIAFQCIFHLPLFSGPEWHTIQLLPVAVVSALALWAFRISLGSQNIFATNEQ